MSGGYWDGGATSGRQANTNNTPQIILMLICLVLLVGVVVWFLPGSSRWWQHDGRPAVVAMSWAAGAVVVGVGFVGWLCGWWSSLRRWVIRRPVISGAMLQPPNIRPADRLTFGRFNCKVLPDYCRRFVLGGGPVALDVDDVAKTTVVIGSMGMGKSQVIFNLLDQLRARFPTVPTVVNDPKGEFIKRYYSPGDMVYAPHFVGSAGWDVLGDFHRLPEIVAATLSAAVGYFSRGAKEQFWRLNALEALKSVFLPSVGGAALTPGGVSTAWTAHKSATGADDGGAKDVALTAASPLRALMLAALHSDSVPAGERVGVADILDGGGHMLYLYSTPQTAALHNPIFGGFLSALLLYAVGLPDLPAGELRLILVVDEAATFSFGADLVSVFRVCRSKGVAVIIASQDLPAGADADEWARQKHNLITLGVSDPATVKALSTAAGRLTYREKDKDGREQERDRDLIPAAQWGRMAAREFVSFHAGCIAAGKTIDTPVRTGSRPWPAKFDALAGLVRQLPAA